MCYSAQITASYKKYVREFGAKLSLADFVETFWLRNNTDGPSITIPKAMEAAFANAEDAELQPIKALIAEFAVAETRRLEEKIAEQVERLQKAEAKLLKKTTKTALEDQRIARSKIDGFEKKIADLKRTELTGDDSRIFPFNYAPLMVSENGQRMVLPMRYHCRPAGKPAFYDVKFPGLYNARRDSLRGFWSGQYGHTHGLLVLDAFYENVNMHRWQKRQLVENEKVENVRLQFKPQNGQQLLVACVWSRWSSPGQRDLLSFAIITDDPPPEISEAGHDRCPIAIKPKNIDAWLNPDPSNLAALDAILENQDRPYYESHLTG